MSDAKPCWYVTTAGQSPSGPFTSDQVIELMTAGRIAPTAMCWREGMPQWLALAQVEPFASAAQPVAPRPRSTALPPVAGPPQPRLPRTSSGVANGLAIASLVLAIPALLVAIVPLLGAMAIYPAAIALLLSIIGLAWGLAARARIGGLPVSALVVSLLPVLISSFWIYSVYRAGKAVEQALNVQRARQTVIDGGEPESNAIGGSQRDQNSGVIVPPKGGSTEPFQRGNPETRKVVPEAPRPEAPKLEPKYAAPPLKHGAVVHGLSVAIVPPIQRQSNVTEITVALRLVGDLTGHSGFLLVIRDDRANTYSSGVVSVTGSTWARHDSSPPSIKQLPLGFTWTSTVKVEMPGIAPIDKIVLAEDPWKKSEGPTLDFRSDAGELFDQKIPDDSLLPSGRLLPIDKDLETRIGGLIVDSPSSTDSSGRYVLELNVNNRDYNPHEPPVFETYLQSAAGAIRKAATSTSGGADPFGSNGNAPIPGKETKTIHMPIASSSESGSDGRHPRSILLYRREGSYSQPTFCGFVPLPTESTNGTADTGGMADYSGYVANRGSEQQNRNRGPANAADTQASDGTKENWQSTTGAKLRLEDDGKSLRISLAQPNPVLTELTGTLDRKLGQSSTDRYEGSLQAQFAANSKSRTLRVVVTFDDQNHLRLRFANWPTFDKSGKLLGEKVYTENLSRSQ